jgi:hypothetical protein
LARKEGIYLCHKFSGASLKEIACKLDVGEARQAVNKKAGRSRIIAGADKKCDKKDN